jgi:hypothetical protein
MSEWFLKGPKGERLGTMFWDYVEFSNSGCWLWTGPRRGLHDTGYGAFGKNEYAHRFIFRMIYGDIPKGKSVCHRCDVPLCVNPRHLFCGTQQDNMRDMVSKGRHFKRRGGDHPNGHFTDEQVADIRFALENCQMTQSEIARASGVSQAAIWCIFRRKTYKHVA